MNVTPDQNDSTQMHDDVDAAHAIAFATVDADQEAGRYAFESGAFADVSGATPAETDDDADGAQPTATMDPEDSTSPARSGNHATLLGNALADWLKGPHDQP